ncbi:MAG TPA: PaaI family thioesterase [Candidatus Acidoferrum sp.]|nr:PaaI family thioesterase [Candidatus Acidoferrum sp.]
MSPRKLNAQQAREILVKVPFNVLLDMRLHRVHQDGITIECTVREELRNSAGIAHGGVAAALADAAVGIAIHRHVGGKRPLTTVELKINYFQPVREGRIFARSHLLRIGSTLCVGRVELHDEKARPIGTAIVTYIFLDAKRGAQAKAGASKSSLARDRSRARVRIRQD